MQPSPPSTRLPSAAFAAAVVYGLLVYVTLPAGVVAFGDDFGYLKSVVQTLQHGRPWTNDWLEPWAASLSVLSALLYKATGNFLFAMQGLQAAAAAAGWLGAFALFRTRVPSTGGAGALALLLMGFPVLFGKTLEYGGMVLYLPCLLWALWAAERGRGALFFVVWAVAVASRQSAVAWLALPLAAVVAAGRGGPGGWRAPALVLLLGGGWLAVLVAGMNPTHSQIVRTGAVFWRADLATALAALGSGSGVFLLAAGLGRLVVALGQPSARAWPRRRGLALAVAGLAVVGLFDARRLVTWDFVDMANRASWLYAKCAVALAVAGWLLARARMAAPPVALAAAGLLLLALRADRYDYYYVDLALAALFCARRYETVDARASEASPAWLRWLPAAVTVAGVGLCAYQAREGYRLKLALDHAWARCSVYEPALRAGRIAPPELFDAPFGYAGWHLHAYAAGKGSDTFRRFLDFDRRTHSVELQVLPVDDGGPRPPTGDTPTQPLAEGRHRLGWARDYRFILRRVAVESVPVKLGADYRFVPFPLNNAEWRALIDGPSVN